MEAGAAVSAPVRMSGLNLLTILPPEGWTAANLAVDGSEDGTTWYQLGDERGALFSFPVTLGRSIQLPPALGIASWRFLRFRSVGAADATTEVAQDGGRIVAGFLKHYAHAFTTWPRHEPEVVMATLQAAPAASGDGLAKLADEIAGAVLTDLAAGAAAENGTA